MHHALQENKACAFTMRAFRLVQEVSVINFANSARVFNAAQFKIV
jgi:hypothetical protein